MYCRQIYKVKSTKYTGYIVYVYTRKLSCCSFQTIMHFIIIMCFSKLPVTFKSNNVFFWIINMSILL